MDYNTFLDEVIRIGIAGATKSYTGTKNPNHPKMLEGAKAGFEACRGLDPVALTDLLHDANHNTYTAQITDDPEYWKVACFSSEVYWVCNVISAILMNENQPVIVMPTCRAVMLANEILTKGVGGVTV